MDADGNHVVVAGTTDSFTVVARDQYGNRKEGGGLNIAGKIDGPSGNWFVSFSLC